MFEFQIAPKISSLSTRYVRCIVSATDQGQPVDPTSSTVKFAFIYEDPDVTPTPQPVSGDWKAGSWETTSTDYLARCLVGPNGVVTFPQVGSYSVWIQVVLAPETLIESVGDLTIY